MFEIEVLLKIESLRNKSIDNFGERIFFELFMELIDVMTIVFVVEVCSVFVRKTLQPDNIYSSRNAPNILV